MRMTSYEDRNDRAIGKVGVRIRKVENRRARRASERQDCPQHDCKDHSTVPRHGKLASMRYIPEARAFPREEATPAFRSAPFLRGSNPRRASLVSPFLPDPACHKRRDFADREMHTTDCSCK